ncbi:sigma 54-interacting transcriptional regulator [Azospirillum griseum]|uniref:HTH-type transcriptional regulatory protein TyrR n=1 Tax=Azospirillum griseum TaxID=2496639 RepID=A0A431VBA8_9PROT|nr:sigma 54-interacting transcriptional regulator [Azospirillum griseum]RTR15743.1 Fis family transcriptional regulator [Azospirillum griseum]
MMLDIRGENRVGITSDILAVIARAGFDLRRLEVETGHVYAHVPGLRAADLPGLRMGLEWIPGVQAVAVIDALPGDRRREALETLVASFPDPLLVVAADGGITAANAAAQAILGPTAALPAAIASRLRGKGGNNGGGSGDGTLTLTVNGRAYLVEMMATGAIGGTAKGDGGPGWLVIFRASQRIGRELALVGPGESGTLDRIVGDSSLIAQVKDRIRRFAEVDAPVLIGGETGVGKELVARAIHGAGPRRSAPFLALNCAALPENLVESELFGYAPGAFSGATRDGKLGLLELADGGVLFLDEIGEMSPYVQSKLLRFLEDGAFRRVGGKQERRVSVRILSATHRDLARLCGDGRFREDLLYRLSVLRVDVPALRERRQDIPRLIDRFLSGAAAQIGRPTPRLTADALERLTSHPWPGNVRQLQNVVFRTLTLADGPVIGLEHLDLSRDGGGDPKSAGEDDVLPPDWHTAQRRFEADLLRRLWPLYPSSRKLAARLGVSHTTIAQKLKAAGITP